MNEFDEIKIKANYCLKCPAKPCKTGCPLGNNIPDFIRHVENGDFEASYEVLMETTALPSICGRICPHDKQCQGNCVRRIKGEAVRIGELEAFVGDRAIEGDYDIAHKDKNNKRVAVVGSGPAGLTCAAFLAREGYNVTIYEKHNELGGLLRHGIPEFRLDRELLDKQIQKILDLGIESVVGKELGKDYTLEDLHKNYDAVFLAFGANISKKMNVPGADLTGVFGGNELLELSAHPDYNGKTVVVIGGGNVAMDAARTVKYLGAQNVYVIYRRSEEQMPAEPKEIADAKREGIEFLFQNNVVEIKGNEDGEVTGIECVKTELVQEEGEDRLVPVAVEDSNYVLDTDFVIWAIGAKAENSVVDGLGVDLDEDGFVKVDDDFMTSTPNVFAGGDLIGNYSTVAWAARNGRDAAEAISRMV